jgi:hypothetical protein
MNGKTHIAMAVLITHAAVLLVLTISSDLWAEDYDYTFRVPVELNNIPADIKKAYVRVIVRDIDETHSSGSTANVVGRGYHTIDLLAAGGNVNETVVLQFNVNSGRAMSEAKSYRVYLFFPQRDDDGIGRWACEVMRTDGGWPHDPSKPCIDQYIRAMP